jgi:spore maturation protein CgeB
MTYKIVKITSFYKAFLNDYYSKNKDIINKSYSEQYDNLMAQKYGWSDYFKKHLAGHGIETIEIIHNAYPLQMAWANENDFVKSSNIVIAQLKYYKPDVIFFQDSVSFSVDFYNEVKRSVPSVKLMFGHCCTPFSTENIKAFSKFDFLLTCSPHFLKKFESHGLKVILFYHAFEESLLEKIYIDNNYSQIDFLFVGSFIQNKEFHDARLLFIEELVNAGLLLTIYTRLSDEKMIQLYSKKLAYVIIQLFKKIGLSGFMFNTPGLKKLVHLNEIPKKQHFSGKLRERVVNSTLFGLEMLKLLAKSRIGFNIHGGGAGDFAANARLFEVTGVGSLLLTDHKSNINDLFMPDFEIVTYKSLNECIYKANWLLNHPDECKKIAKAGQLRTLKDHTIKNRVDQLHNIISSMMNKK